MKIAVAGRANRTRTTLQIARNHTAEAAALRAVFAGRHHPPDEVLRGALLRGVFFVVVVSGAIKPKEATMLHLHLALCPLGEYDGMTAFYAGRWGSRKGEFGQWSDPARMVVMM